MNCREYFSGGGGGGRKHTKIHPGSGNWSSGDGGKSGGGRGVGEGSYRSVGGI